MMTSLNDYDVIVIGGGPAGATTATLVAAAGHRVLLAEREAEPVFKIGESLMPATYWTLERLGLLEKLQDSHFPKKYSVQFYTKMGRASAPFYFFENDPHESSQTWQVKRSEFDQLLLDNAAEKGVEVRRGLSAQGVKLEGDEAKGVRFKNTHGETGEIRCRVVVDATGQGTLLSRQLGLMVAEPNLKNVSFFTHFEGATRDSGRDEGATLILHTEDQDSWFWYIPLPNNIVSVGVVGSVSHLVAGRSGDPQRVFDEELARCPALVPRLAGACQAMPIKVLRDFSYRSRRIAGEGWVLVGDAFGFVDPIYSTGVFLALKSGEHAADAILEGLAANDLSGARLGAWGPGYAAGVEALRKLVYAFYQKDFSFAEFSRRFPQHRRELVNLLIGNVYRDPPREIFEAMETMITLPKSAPLEILEPAVA